MAPSARATGGRRGFSTAVGTRLGGTLTIAAVVTMSSLTRRTWLPPGRWQPALDGTSALGGWVFALHWAFAFLVVVGVTALVAPASPRRADWRLLSVVAAAVVGLTLFSTAGHLRDASEGRCLVPGSTDGSRVVNGSLTAEPDWSNCRQVATATGAWTALRFIGWGTLPVLALTALVAPAGAHSPSRRLVRPLVITISGVAAPLMTGLVLSLLGPQDPNSPDAKCRWFTNTSWVFLAASVVGFGLTVWGTVTFARRRSYLAIPLALAALFVVVAAIAYGLALTGGGAGWCHSD